MRSHFGSLVAEFHSNRPVSHDNGCLTHFEGDENSHHHYSKLKMCFDSHNRSLLSPPSRKITLKSERKSNLTSLLCLPPSLLSLSLSGFSPRPSGWRSPPLTSSSPPPPPAAFSSGMKGLLLPCCCNNNTVRLSQYVSDRQSFKIASS